MGSGPVLSSCPRVLPLKPKKAFSELPKVEGQKLTGLPPWDGGLEAKPEDVELPAKGMIYHIIFRLQIN